MALLLVATWLLGGATITAGAGEPGPDRDPPRLADATAEQPIDLRALLASYRTIHPADDGLAVQDREWRVGHLEVTLSAGTLHALVTDGGERLGFFFTGRGRFLYRSEDAADRLVLEARPHRLALDRAYPTMLTDEFDRLLVFAAAPLSGDPSQGQGPSATLSAATRSSFDSMWKQIGLSYLEYDHLAAEARLNGNDRQFIYAEFGGGRETIAYQLDRARWFYERLQTLRKVQGHDVRFVDPVSVQDLAPEGRPDRNVRLAHADLELTTADNIRARIASDGTFEVQEDGLRLARLRLMNNRDPVHADWASTKNALGLAAVKDAAGRDCPFSHRYNEVLVLLPAPAARGDTVRLRTEAFGDILVPLGGRRGDNYFELLSVTWYPIGDVTRNAGHTFTLKVKTARPFVPVAAGTTVKLEESPAGYSLETKSDRRMGQAVVFAGKYVTETEQAGDRTIRAHAYAMARQDLLAKIPRVARQFLDYYEKTLGAYPFGDLDIVEAPRYVDLPEGMFMAFGIAPPGMVLITSEAWDARRDAQTRQASRQVNARLAHEIAHQWFPHQAAPATSRDWWLSESLAEYLSGMAVGAAGAEEKGVGGFATALSQWRFEARACAEVGPLEAAAHLRGPDASEERRCLLYSRGPLVLHMLRAASGEEKFAAILRRFLEKARTGPVATADFRKSAEEVLGLDLAWFFDDWYGKGGIPKIHVTHAIVAGSDGGYALQGTVTQPQGAAFRRILIPLLLEYGDGRREVRLIFQEKPAQEFRFPLASRPTAVRVDPFQNNLAVYD